MKRIVLAGLIGLACALPAAAQQVSLKNYGQQLSDELGAKYKDILLIGLHITPPGSPDNIITASNFGRIGKKADEDDMGVINNNKVKAEPNPQNTRYAVELPQRDVSGNTIGALGLNFPYKVGDDKAALEKRAEMIRDELASRTLDSANLMEPFPYVPMATTLLRAQKLVNQLKEKSPDVLVAVMNVSTPAGTAPIAGSTIGRHGKDADAGDMAVIQSGQSKVANDGTQRLWVKTALQDTTGKTVGTLSLAFKAGDATALTKRAESLRDWLKPQVASAAALLAIEP